MQTYNVLKPFDGHAKGDTVTLNDRQALHLELSGFIAKAKKAKKATAAS